MADPVTQKWIRNRSDELAAANGCRFDEALGQYVVNWIEAHCRLWEGSRGPMLLKDWQYEATMRMFGWVRWSARLNRWTRRFARASIWISKKNGKCLSLDTPIPTPDGWTTMGEIGAGDTVFSADGTQCKVIAAYQPRVDQDCYEVTFSNGEKIKCNGEHLWLTTALQRQIGGHGKGKIGGGNKWTGSLGVQWIPTAVRSTTEIFATLDRGDGARNHSVALQKPLELPERQLLIDPYVLGVWLGDGHTDAARLTCSVEDEIPRLLCEAGTLATMTRKDTRSKGACYRMHKPENGLCIRGHEGNRSGDGKHCLACDRLTRAARRSGHPLPSIKTSTFTADLRTLGVLGDKHIPASYLRGSRLQRLALLQGLMDTDGTISKDGKGLVYCSKLRVLADGVGELLSSLGIKYRIKTNRPIISGIQREYYNVQFHAFRDDVAAFRLARKLARMRRRSCLKMKARSGTVQITSIKKIDSIQVRCITVDHPSGMYLCGKTMIPTHNSPSAAAWALYLLAGDGEQGNHVFFAATDGQQARIVAKHALEMVKASPSLSSEIGINLSLMQLTHHPTLSTAAPISSGDNRAAKAKQGLNGSVIIDECFVAGTKIDSPCGEIDIDKVRCGDRIYCATGIGQVIGTSCRFASDLYRIGFSDGTFATCTGNHRIFTDRGWIAARLLAIGTISFGQQDVRALWQTVFSETRHHDERCRIRSKRSRMGASQMLLEEMSQRIQRQHFMDDEIANGREDVPDLLQSVSSVGIALRREKGCAIGTGMGQADLLLNFLLEEAEEPDGQCSHASQGEGYAASHEAFANQAWRKRQTTSVAAASVASRIRRRMGSGVADSDRACQGWERISNVLQSGYRSSGTKDRYRGGRIEPRFDCAAVSGPKETALPERIRVVSVSRIERESPCAVFNLHVSGHPSYFANGKLVHNCHVVEKSFISQSAIGRAGASRDEPFHIEVSTAGKDPDSYGYSQYVRGKTVESGEVEDQGLFFLCYEAPQDLSDDDLAADPVKWGRMANPTWGRIIQEDEYLADYNRSKSSLADLADFKTFRLNIWQQSASPWIRKEDWDACRVRFSEADLEGELCSAGLDLAITRDMSALAFMFPRDDDHYRMLVYFFLPEVGVRRLAKKIPQMLEWVRDGYVIETPGETTDYRFIRKMFSDKANLFSIDKLIYDEHFAEQVTQEMHEETGVERLKLPQTITRLNEPTQNMERLILDRKLEHNGNPVLSWQMGHVNIKTDCNANKRPVKPSNEDHKKIDGVLACIMALAGAMDSRDDEGWFAASGGLMDRGNS